MKARGCQDEVGEVEQPCHAHPCISRSEMELDPNLRRIQFKQGSYMIQLISQKFNSGMLYGTGLKWPGWSKLQFS